MEFIDSKIIYLFAQKLNVPLKKNIYPLPCGLENKRFRANGKIENFNKVLEGQKNLSRKQKVFCSFNIHTNFETRKALLDQVSTDSKVDTKKSLNQILRISMLYRLINTIFVQKEIILNHIGYGNH